MKITIKEDINTKSLMLKHDILLQASGLIMGREGVLQTEKELYLIIAMINNLMEEDLITMCNEDGRDLGSIMTEFIEPVYVELMEKEEYKVLYEELKELFLARCKEIWDNQHSIMGVFDSILTMLSSMSTEDKKEALVETAKIAEEAYDRRTQTLESKAQEANSKLEQLVQKYEKLEGKQEESNAE